MEAPFQPGLKSRLKHSPIYPLLRKRRFQAYCVGGPKTGTTSLAQLFQGGYNAEHEPLHAGTMEQVLAALDGSTSRGDLTRYLRWRDRELYLEMESSHLLAVFIESLVDLFPDSRFILTVRDPRSWLGSMITQQLNGREHWAHQTTRGPRAAFFPALHRHLVGGDQHRRWPGEEVLEEHALFPLDGYLSWWAEHNRTVLEAVPSHRLLVVRTERISQEIGRISDFLGVPAATLSREGEHANRAPKRRGLVDRIDPDLLADRIEHHCAAVLELVRRAIPQEI